MTAQWVKYDGSDEQIVEINAGFTCNGVIFKLDTGKYTEPYYSFTKRTFTNYLICEPHPYAAMICQWAQTGQPVYVRITEEGDKNEFPELSDFIESVKHVETYCTNKPNWNIPGAEYSFTPFEEEV